MDLLINTSAKDRSAAAVDGFASFAALTGPDAFPQLVLGTLEPITLKFLSAASTYETWTADPTYTMSLSLGLKTPDGQEDFADSAAIATLITNGKSGALDLTGPSILSHVRTILACFPINRRDVILTLQVAVTDPLGGKRVFAQLPVQVNGKVA